MVGERDRGVSLRAARLTTSDGESDPSEAVDAVADRQALAVSRFTLGSHETLAAACDW